MTPKSKTSNGGSAAAVVETSNASNPERERIFNAYRQWDTLRAISTLSVFSVPAKPLNWSVKASTPAKPAPSIPAPSASKSITSTRPNAAAGF